MSGQKRKKSQQFPTDAMILSFCHQQRSLFSLSFFPPEHLFSEGKRNDKNRSNVVPRYAIVFPSCLI